MALDLSGVLRRDVDEDRLDVAIAARRAGESEGVEIFQEQLCWATSGELDLPPDKPLPLAFLPAPCSYREAPIKVLDETGRPWICSVTTMNIAGVQAAVMANLAVGVLGRTSILPTMRQLGPECGFPPLPKFGVAAFTRKGGMELSVQPIIEFLVSELAGTGHQQ